VQLDLFADGTAFAYNNNDNPFWGSSDFGQTWTPLPLPPSEAGTPEIDFASPEFGVVRTGDHLYVTEDKGLTVQRIGSPPVPQRYGAEDRFPSIDTMEVIRGTETVVLAGDGFWIKDGCPVETEDGYIWVTEDRGDTWRRVTIPFPSLGHEIEFLNGRYGLVLLYEMEVTSRSECGYGSTGIRTSVLLTTDGGRSFKEIHSAYHEDEDTVFSVAMPTPRRILLGTQGGKILLSTNQGRSFRKIVHLKNEVDEETGQDSGFAIDGLVFGTRKIGYAGTNGRGTWRTEDGGATWSRETSIQSVAGLNIGDIVATGPDRALAGGAHAIARRVPI